MHPKNQSIEWLNAEKIQSEIKFDPISRFHSLKIFKSIPSTNTYLLEVARLQGDSGTVCMAEEQTAGRGRRGRTWLSGEGRDICFSLLWRLENFTGLSIAIGVILARVLKQCGIDHGLQLKWPNDVLFKGRKLAGILIECADRTGVVIGIGLNLTSLPNADPAWISLQEIIQRPPERNKLAGLLLNELLATLPVYETQGLAPFLQEWQECDALMGKRVDILMTDKTITGVMEGINAQGELILRNEVGEVQVFCYGEVSARIK